MRVFVASVIAIVAAMPRAQADGVGVIAVVDGATEPGARAALAAAIGGAIEAGPGRPARVVLDAVAEARTAVAAGAVPVATLERFRRVRDQIDEGWHAFVRVQVELAASLLAVARTDAESIVALPGGAVLYADASLRLGAVLAHQGRLTESHAAIALALALDPERPITLAEFSPDIVAVIDSVRAQTPPTRSVRIATEPAAALINIDGKDLGAAPLSVDLTYGQHVIIARRAAYESHGQAFAVDANVDRMSLALRRDAAAARLADGARVGLADAGAQELTDVALRFADLDDVALVARTQRRGGPALLVQRCAGLPARCTAVVEVGYTDRSGLPSAAREGWQTVRTADLRYPPSVFADARTGEKPVDGRCRWCRSPILWGGVGAAALIGTIVVIAVVSSSQPPPVLGVDPDRF